MGQDTFPLGPFVGINNRLPPDKLRRAPQDGGGQFVQSAVNIDFTGANTLRRRPGSELALSGVGCHSFWADGDMSFVVDDDKLYRVVADGDFLTRIELATVTPGLQFSYAAVPGGYFASNGVQRLRIEGGTATEWGVPTPALGPNLSADAGGSLPPGRYQVVISFTDAAGEEGGTSVPQVVDVPEHGRVVVTNIEQRAGFTTAVYMTACNGETFYHIGPAVAGSRVISVLNDGGYRPVGLLHLQTPAGHIVRYLNGRLLVAAGNILYYSEPYHLGLYNPARNYIQFPAPITMVEPCQNGFYLSADQTYWVDGEIGQADLNPVLPYRAVLGTSTQVPNANQVWWMSERGAVLGDQSGQVKNLQEDSVVVQPAAAGASLFREQDGMKQMISTLFGPQSSVMAAQSWMDAEVVRKEALS